MQEFDCRIDNKKGISPFDHIRKKILVLRRIVYEKDQGKQRTAATDGHSAIELSLNASLQKRGQRLTRQALDEELTVLLGCRHYEREPVQTIDGGVLPFRLSRLREPFESEIV